MSTMTLLYKFADGPAGEETGAAGDEYGTHECSFGRC